MISNLNNQQAASAFQLKGGIYTLTTLELHTSSQELISRKLAGMVSKAPHFFQQTPVVLGLDGLPDNEPKPDLTRIKYLLNQSGMVLVAIRGGCEELKQHAAIAGIAWLPPEKRKAHDNVVMINSGKQDLPVETIEAKPDLAHTPVKIIEKPVRSGQQVYTPGDLVVTAAVSEGAELLAGGHIHIYGPLRGRALAGVNDRSDARIFCTQFEAELISISGQYKLTGQSNSQSPWGKHWGKSVVIKRDSDHLHIGQL